jgi:hypothetical protein
MRHHLLTTKYLEFLFLNHDEKYCLSWDYLLLQKYFDDKVQFTHIINRIFLLLTINNNGQSDAMIFSIIIYCFIKTMDCQSTQKKKSII